MVEKKYSVKWDLQNADVDFAERANSKVNLLNGWEYTVICQWYFVTSAPKTFWFIHHGEYIIRHSLCALRILDALHNINDVQ